jgi:hypothetical protein
VVCGGVPISRDTVQRKFSLLTVASSLPRLLRPCLRLPDVRFPNTFARSKATTAGPSRFSKANASIIENAQLAAMARKENSFMIFYEAELMQQEEMESGAKKTR